MRIMLRAVEATMDFVRLHGVGFTAEQRAEAFGRMASLNLRAFLAAKGLDGHLEGGEG